MFCRVCDSDLSGVTRSLTRDIPGDRSVSVRAKWGSK